ncbi:unnamed protein product [Protopolystoma xenopodis]|uniref:Uncharacterized protein n=1 Tax=Protopolystoma xenopodis TaxID=117903 RepID=A0A3S5AQW7_9PLAT|nr:unnamed protein product [Protopolystoma xenopodis]
MNWSSAINDLRRTGGPIWRYLNNFFVAPFFGRMPTQTEIDALWNADEYDSWPFRDALNLRAFRNMLESLTENPIESVAAAVAALWQAPTRLEDVSPLNVTTSQGVGIDSSFPDETFLGLPELGTNLVSILSTYCFIICD